MVQSAGYVAVRSDSGECGTDFVAAVEAFEASGVEGAAGGRVDGAWYVALEECAFFAALGFVDAWHGGHEGFGIWVEGLVVDLIFGCEFDDTPEVHDGDAVTDVAYDGEVVGDEDVREAAFFLKFSEEVDDLGLDGDVEC